ncbi:MAG: hypothetical protein ACLFNU_07545 [Bacteroidales bacterium]
MRLGNILLGLFIIAMMLLKSCTCSKDEVPLESIDLEMSIHRFDQDLFGINPDSIENNTEWLEEKYGDFFSHFTDGIIGIGLPEDPEFSSYLYSFVTDNMVSETYAEVQKVFPNTDKLDQTITNAFKRYKYYFPEKEVPKVYGFVSGFNNSVMIAEGIVGVGFDRYLGRDCEYYPMLGIHKYLRHNMHPKKIPSDIIRSWAFGEFQFNDTIDDLASNIIYEGKLMYLTKRLLPEQSDSLIFGFTPDQMEWCKRNEAQMWGHLVEHKLLFTTEQFTINQFVGDAPFTHGFTKESPGKAAVWLGYRIVSRFMRRNNDYTLSMLMNEKDYQSILKKSRYNP